VEPFEIKHGLQTLLMKADAHPPVGRGGRTGSLVLGGVWGGF